jgi:hypothetical protein
MRLIHRIFVSKSAARLKDLETLGVAQRIDPEALDKNVIAFQIEEDDQSWPDVRTWCQSHGTTDTVETEFSDREIGEARWLDLVPDWHHGYPQPRDDCFGFLTATYDLTDSCQKCGAGKRQKAPFQMKAEPKWGRRGVLQLNWVFDEYFVTPEVWRSICQPRGIRSRAVLNRRLEELKTVVQLVVEEEVHVATAGLAGEKCTACGRFKYLPVTKGPSPRPITEPDGHMAKSIEYFGSGASASKLVLVSQDLARALRAKGIRGASVRPAAG